MAITYFDPKTARGPVGCGRCLRLRFRVMGEVCTLVLFIIPNGVLLLIYKHDSQGLVFCNSTTRGVIMCLLAAARQPA